MGARVYDPYTGTFTQPDPVQGGGANAYGYTDGDPVNETDLSGDCVGPLALIAPLDVLCAELGAEAVGGLVALFAGTAVISAAEIIHEHQVQNQTAFGGWVNGPSGVVYAKGGKQNVKQSDPAFKDENGVPLSAEQVKAIHDDPATSTALKKKASQQLKALGAKRNTQS
jgi:uncharacterized protein RhaS with RHS repeats